jgi:hypothetical protein
MAKAMRDNSEFRNGKRVMRFRIQDEDNTIRREFDRPRTNSIRRERARKAWETGRG